jgi:Flp pilus assembly protein TadD
VGAAGLGIVLAATAWTLVARPSPRLPASGAPRAIVVDYPLEGSIFPPEFPSPTWQWREPDEQAVAWTIGISFADGTPSLRVQAKGERLRPGEIDPRCVSANNQPPILTREQAAAHTWTPDADTWYTIKEHSAKGPATIVITGFRAGDPTAISRGSMRMRTSVDPVGAPIFYRDVPLMPSANERGVIKPLDAKSVPLIAWRLRAVGETQSRVVMEGLHTCANCHSFSADGTTLGMDMDGPQNDKGLYALVPVRPHMSIGKEDLVAWSDFRGKLGSKLRVGFMSQVSPDAKFVITTVNDPGVDQTDHERRRDPVDLVRNYYVANFKDYRFLQVFFPTRGVLAWYSRATRHLQALPGADDPRFVHTNAVWAPDGKSLVFARAAAQDAYPPDAQPAQFANDPNERQVRFDLYRIPFNQGRGGQPEPIAGASGDGVSHSFPKVSPDGRWIVFVQSRNGLLMRPDSQLTIVPAAGGQARRMTCNTSLMNSWHSFSPNGRWLVFSSKSRSPYTQMFLTHIDVEGNDSPAILIENATAANRAVNIPEFVNIPADGMVTIDAPAARYALHVDVATQLMNQGKFEEAAEEWKKVLALTPDEWWAENAVGVALAETGKRDEAMTHFRRAVALNPQYADAYDNLGEALSSQGATTEAIVQFEKALRIDAQHANARKNLGVLLARTGQTDKALFHLKKLAEANPDSPEAHRNLGHALAEKGDLNEACQQLEDAARLAQRRDVLGLYLLGSVYADLRRLPEAERTLGQALDLARAQKSPLLQAIVATQNKVAQLASESR